jgi:SAM-dependent methyltransferase
MNRFHRWYCQTDRWRTTLSDKVLPWAVGRVELGDDVLEVGPGPGLTTDALSARLPRMTCLEIDPAAAAALSARLAGVAPHVTVVEGDGTAMPFEDGRFSGAVCFTMLHHVPSAELQDRLLSEVYRVLRPGATFAGTDSTVSMLFRVAHVFDTMVLVDPAGFGERLERAGFAAVRVDTAARAFRFCAVKP